MNKILKKVRNIFISGLILLIIAVVIGFGYVWYMGQNNAEITDTETAQSNDPFKPNINHVKQAENSPVGVSIQSLSSPVVQGSNASISIRTNNNVKCTISVKYNEIASVDSGLVEKSSDEYGTVSWSWTVSENTPVGKWPVRIDCFRNDLWGMVIGDLVVTKKS